MWVAVVETALITGETTILCQLWWAPTPVSALSPVFRMHSLLEEYFQTLCSVCLIFGLSEFSLCFLDLVKDHKNNCIFFIPFWSTSMWPLSQEFSFPLVTSDRVCVHISFSYASRGSLLHETLFNRNAFRIKLHIAYNYLLFERCILIHEFLQSFT